MIDGGAGSRLKLIDTDGRFSMDGSGRRVGVGGGVLGICAPGRQVRRRGHGGRQPCHRHTGGQSSGTASRGASWKNPHRHPHQNRWAKTLGGAAGGFTCGGSPVVDSCATVAAPNGLQRGAAAESSPPRLKSLELVAGQAASCAIRSAANARWLRQAAGGKRGSRSNRGRSDLPVMSAMPLWRTKMADRLLEGAIYVIGFSFRVPQGRPRIRIQLAAAHSQGANGTGGAGLCSGGQGKWAAV